MEQATITDADEGKRVLNADGIRLGRIVDITSDRGYVEPDPALTDTIKAKLGWGDVTADAHPIDDATVDRITDDAVYIRDRS